MHSLCKCTIELQALHLYKIFLLQVGHLTLYEDLSGTKKNVESHVIYVEKILIILVYLDFEI